MVKRPVEEEIDEIEQIEVDTKRYNIQDIQARSRLDMDDNILQILGGRIDTLEDNITEITPESIGLGEVENLSSIEILDRLTDTEIIEKLGFTPKREETIAELTNHNIVIESFKVIGITDMPTAVCEYTLTNQEQGKAYVSIKFQIRAIGQENTKTETVTKTVDGVSSTYDLSWVERSSQIDVASILATDLSPNGLIVQNRQTLKDGEVRQIVLNTVIDFEERANPEFKFSLFFFVRAGSILIETQEVSVTPELRDNNLSLNVGYNIPLDY